MDPSPRPLVPSPTPQGILQKTRFFFFLYALETSKVRRKLRNLLRPWGPCRYHLPPRHRSPWRPPEPQTWGLGASGNPCHSLEPSPLLAPSCTALVSPLCRPALGPCPYHLPPPEPKPLDPPPRALVPSPTLQGIPTSHREFFFFLYALPLATLSNQAPTLPLLAPPPCRPPGQLWTRAPTTYPPRTEALGPPSPSPYAFPHPTGHPSKNAIFLLFVRVRNVKNTTQVAKFAPSLGPVPLPPTPPEPKPLDPPPRALVPSPTPQGILQNTPFFFFLYALETSKIRRKLRNLLRPWGPCPYHLPPRNQSPWTPLRAPLYPPPPPPYRASFKTVLETSTIQRMLRPWGPCPYHLPPRNQSPWTPLRAPLYPPPPHRESFKKRDFSSFCIRNVKNTTQVAKFAPSLGPVPLPPTPPAPKPLEIRGIGHPCTCLHQASSGAVPLPPTLPEPKPFSPSPCAFPHPTGHPSKSHFSSFCSEICSVPGARAPTTYLPEPKPLDPSPRPLVPSPTPQVLFLYAEICSVSGARAAPKPLETPRAPPLFRTKPQPSPFLHNLPPCPPGQFWGRAPTTYPPRTEALGPPSPNPCAFPHPTGHPSKNAIFLLFDTSCEICSVPGARAPTTDPPGTKALGPPSPSPCTLLQNSPFFFFLSSKYDASCEICSVPGARAPTTYPPGTKALGPLSAPPCTLPHPTGNPSRNLLRPWHPCPCPYLLPEPQPLDPPLPSPCTHPHPTRQKYDASCEICSVPGARAPTAYPPGTEALGPPLPSPCTPPTPQGILQKKSFFFLYALETSKIRRKVYPPTPQGIHQTCHFFFFVRIRNVKNTTQVAKFAPSLGPPGTEALGPPTRAPT